jgi:hypothetical protein
MFMEALLAEFQFPEYPRCILSTITSKALFLPKEPFLHNTSEMNKYYITATVAAIEPHIHNVIPNWG